MQSNTMEDLPLINTLSQSNTAFNPSLENISLHNLETRRIHEKGGTEDDEQEYNELFYKKLGKV